MPDVLAGEVRTFPVGPFAVQAGDVIAHYGNGIALDIGNPDGTDTVLYPAARRRRPTRRARPSSRAPRIPVLLAEQRTYSIAATVETQTSSGGIRKFVDTLPGLGPEGANNLGQYIPVAVPDTTTYPGSDYYEIAVVQYREQMHSDLPPTLLRGYVQLSTSVVPGAQVPLVNTDGTPILLPDGDARRWGWTAPTTSGRRSSPRRTGPCGSCSATCCPPARAANLFLPVDTTVMGSGMGPNMGGMAEPDPQNPMCGMDAEARGLLHRRTAPRSTCTAASPRGSATARRTSGSRPPDENDAVPEGRQRPERPRHAGPRAGAR